MCILTVHNHQQHSTIAQGILHNLNTVVDDLAMFTTMLAANPENLLRAAQIEEVRELLLQGRSALQRTYGNFVADRLETDHMSAGHAPIELCDHVNAILSADVRNAKDYETRTKIAEHDFVPDHLHHGDFVVPTELPSWAAGEVTA